MCRHLARALALLLLICPLAPASGAEAKHAPPANAEARAAARTRFEDARLGMAFHWGVYSMLGKGEGVMEAERLPISEYRKLPPRFHPRKFDAEAWVDAARAAGASYVVVSAKGPDGFCMFGTAMTSYDVVDATPFGRDPLAALAEACRARRVALVISYSLLDWHHPDYFPRGRTGKSAGRAEEGDWEEYVAYYQEQIRELCTNYGEIAGIRLEGLGDRRNADWELDQTIRLIRELQPGALIGIDGEGPAVGEDVRSIDRGMDGLDALANDRRAVPEVVLPLNQSCGYNAGDKAFKSPDRIIRTLVVAAGCGANLVLGVGPGPDGAIGPESTGRLAEVGRWLHTRGDALYGTRRGPLTPREWGASTLKGKVVNLHVLEPQGPIRLPATYRAFEARLGGVALPLKADGDELVLEIPENLRSSPDTIVTLRPSGSGR